jgi:hypothetical protein
LPQTLHSAMINSISSVRALLPGRVMGWVENICFAAHSDAALFARWLALHSQRGNPVDGTSIDPSFPRHPVPLAVRAGMHRHQVSTAR